MKNDILNFILENTDRECLEEQSTKDIASEFKISTAKAYTICSELANEKKITKLEPVNNDKFDCCGWIRNED
jgi:hypothetical protein